MNHTLNSILAAAKRAGLAHNGGAGGEHLLCASGAQLLAFAAAIAEPPAPALPEDIEAILACLGDDAAALRHDTGNTEDERAANMDAAASLLESLAQRLQLPVAAPFQARVHPWLLECFGTMIAGDREERNHRFLEEALELVQACGCSASEAHQLVDYVYGRPVGQPEQEVGGVMVTLAALCLANRMDMHIAAENELARIWTMVEKIRAKQAAKPKHSPLPEAAPSRVDPAEAFTDAVVQLMDAGPAQALPIITGTFVGMVFEVLRSQGHEPTGDVKIDGGLSRDITIHAPKDAAHGQPT